MQQRAMLLIEHGRAAAVAAASSRSRQPRHRALADQVTLELSQRAEHVQDEPATAGRGVDALVQRTKPNVSIAELVHGLHEVDQRAAEPVQLPHHDGVALAREGEGLDSPGAIGLGTTNKSVNSLRQPARLSSSRCRSSFWSGVETRAYPMSMEPGSQNALTEVGSWTLIFG
jgi:hypothetical protein